MIKVFDQVYVMTSLSEELGITNHYLSLFHQLNVSVTSILSKSVKETFLEFASAVTS